MTKAVKRLASAFCRESRISAKNRRSLHISRSHCATVFGSNRTQVPMRNDGIRPSFACLKIVILETVNILASSSAFKARPIRSIRSGSDIGSAVLFWGLHDCIYLLSGFASRQLPHTAVGPVVRAPVHVPDTSPRQPKTSSLSSPAAFLAAPAAEFVDLISAGCQNARDLL